MPSARSVVHRAGRARVVARAAVAAMVAVLALVGAVLPATAATGATGTAVEGPVVVVGVPGVRWDDVTPEGTPALWSLLENGASGTLAARSVRSRACPVDGWLALSAGRRAADAPTEPTLEDPAPLCREPDEPVDGAVPRWPVYLEQAAGENYQARLGLLGDALAQAGVRVVAVGPGAAIAAADSEGALVGRYAPAPLAATAYGEVVGEAAAEADLVLVDVGAVRDPFDLALADPDRASGLRAEQVAVLDTRLGAVLGALPATATVLVPALADSGLTARLELMAATGPGPGGPYEEALLGSRSTRQDGIVQTTDLAPTVLSLLGVPAPAGLVGSPVRALPGSPATAEERLTALLDLDAASRAVQPLVPWFFNGLVVAQIALYGAAALALRNRWGGPDGRRTVLAVLRRVSVLFAAVPVSTFLANTVPWWRVEGDFLAVVAAVTAFALLVSGAALLGPWARRPLGPFGAVAGITAGVLAVDVARGSQLITSSLMGLQPVVAGRFYGLGNVQYALFATGSLLLATALADAALRAGRRRIAVAAVVVVGVVQVVVNGHPALGADFGGPPSTVPAFAVLAMLVAGVRLSWSRVVAVGAGTVLVVGALSVLDWLRPPDERTHLGRFVDELLAGGAWPVVERKLQQNLDILFGSWLSALVPVAALFVALVLMRPVAWGAPALQRAYELSPALRPGLVALIVMLAIGFAVNDSGTVVPAVGATLAIPLLIAASVRVLELDDAGRRPDPPASAHRPRAQTPA